MVGMHGQRKTPNVQTKRKRQLFLCPPPVNVTDKQEVVWQHFREPPTSPKRQRGVQPPRAWGLWGAPENLAAPAGRGFLFSS